jgi:predicted O-methyltransferase YrrM
MPKKKKGKSKRRVFSEAETVARAVTPILSSGRHYRYFAEWERQGFHITPVHYYSPIPDVRSLRDSLWDTSLETPGLDFNDATQLDLLINQFPRFRSEYDRFPEQATGRLEEFSFDNDQFSGTDALALYCMVRYLRPRTVIEIGSGYSTRISLAAIHANDFGRVLCIEPYPDEAADASRGSLLRTGASGLELIEERVEHLEIGLFQELEAGDVLFIDSSHVARIGSDVNFLFFEVLPRLAPGVVVHVHDVFLPGEYPRSWVVEEHRFWNEAYLLRAFLTFNTEFEVLLANHYLTQKYPERLQETFPNAPWWGGGSFWIRRRDPSSRRSSTSLTGPEKDL